MSQLLFEQEEKFYDSKNLDVSFSNEWDEKYVMALPIVYPDPLRKFRDVVSDPDTSTLLRESTKIKIGERLTQEEFKDLVPTGVVQDLIQATQEAKNDRTEIKMAKRHLVNVDDNGLRDRIEDSIEDYYNYRIMHHAENICQHIDALIELDGYPTKMFGAYRVARRRIFTETNPTEADRLLNLLILLGRSSVPPDKRYIEMESVEPTINSNVRTIGT